MTLKQSIDRLYWRLKNGNWRPNQNDVDALNEIVTYINNSKKKDIKENILFTKMYVFCFTEFLSKYQDPNLAQEQLHRILDTKTTDLYQIYLERLNRQEYLSYCEMLGITDEHPLSTTDEQKQKEIEEIGGKFETFKKYLSGFWEYEEVRTKLNDQVSEAYNKFNQKK